MAARTRAADRTVSETKGRTVCPATFTKIQGASIVGADGARLGNLFMAAAVYMGRPRERVATGDNLGLPDERPETSLFRLSPDESAHQISNAFIRVRAV